MPTQEQADRKADKLIARAEKLEQKAQALHEQNAPYRGDIAFNTQPGHIPERARVIRRTEKAFELTKEAEKLRNRAARARQHVAGTAEARRQEKRKNVMEWLTLGAAVRSPLWGVGIVRKINKKTVQIETDRGMQKEGIHWLKPA